eukprot:12417348-Alexandrium_andersonii.AAC.1
MAASGEGHGRARQTAEPDSARTAASTRAAAGRHPTGEDQPSRTHARRARQPWPERRRPPARQPTPE